MITREQLTRKLSVARTFMLWPIIFIISKYGKGYPFRLENGANARLYWLKNPKMAKVAKACLSNANDANSNVLDGPSLHYFYAVEVDVPGDPIYIIVWCWLNHSAVVSRFETRLQQGKVNELLVYRNAANYPWHGLGALLARSILLNANPAVCVLLKSTTAN